jgi:O-antigen ligase
MIHKLFHKNFSLIICFLLWFFLFGSINVYPEDLLNIKSLFDIIKTSRIIIPIMIGILIFIFLLIKIYTNKKKIIISNYLSIFFLIFFFQLIGVFFTDRINFETLYVIFFSFIIIILFIFIEYLEIQRIYYYFLYSLIFFILISSVILLSIKLDEFLLGIKNLNFYSIFHPDLTLIGYPPPRSTGYSRMLTILVVFIVIWIENKKKSFNSPYFYLILLLASAILLFQSRGSYLCYVVSIISVIFILNYRNNLFTKLIKLILYIFGPILIIFFLSIVTHSKDSKEAGYLNQDSNSSKNIKNSIEDLKNNRIVSNKTTSGRIDLWLIGLNEFDKKKFFGYGPQADRIIISEYYKKIEHKHNPYGNNISNGLVYTFLSGGYFSALLFIILYIKNIYYVLKYIKKFKNKIHLPTQLSFIYIILFSVRSLFENSYAVWGIDHMFLLVSMGILNYQLMNKKIYEGFSINSLLK